MMTADQHLQQSLGKLRKYLASLSISQDRGSSVPVLYFQFSRKMTGYYLFSAHLHIDNFFVEDKTCRGLFDYLVSLSKIHPGKIQHIDYENTRLIIFRNDIESLQLAKATLEVLIL